MKVDVVTGTLGSGKTTLINHILPSKQHHGIQLAVLVNDIGQLNTDSARIHLPQSNVLGYASGCVCCERREDLERILQGIDSAQVQHLIIEPSGAANPLEIIDTIMSKPDLHLQNVIATVPIQHLKVVQHRPSFTAGIKAANIIGLTWPSDAESLDKTHTFLDTLHATPHRFAAEALTYETIKQAPAYESITTTLITPRTQRLGLNTRSTIQPHEHYQTYTHPLNPHLPLDALRATFKSIASTHLPRAKGIIPDHGISFDIINGTYKEHPLSEHERSLALPYIVIIGDQDLPLELLQPLINHPSKQTTPDSSTLEDKLAQFCYYYARTATTQPSINGNVQANFEAPDEAYTTAKSIYLSHGDANPLRLILPAYVDIRIKALDQLDASHQENKHYAGIMLGSFIAQMLGPWDTVPFQYLTDNALQERIKQKMPQFFGHLSQFGEIDFRYIATTDAYSAYFAKMAKQAKPYVSSSMIEDAKQNMHTLYLTHKKDKIAELWNTL